MPSKKEILVIKTGGTVCQKRNEKNVLYVPNDQNYMHLIPEAFNVANITELDKKPIDSTNMKLMDRKNFAKTVYSNHDKYDGFVIIQGTDTLAASAITMNYMIQNFKKPIVFTGSQKSIYEEGTDAKRNIFDSIVIATQNIGESIVVFDKKIIRGSRAVKRHSEDLFGFYSPNAPLLGKVVYIGANLQGQIERDNSKKPDIFTSFNQNVFYFPQISGTKTNLLEKIIMGPECDGIIIGGYGTGNINEKYLEAINIATKRGKPVAITTKCPHGKVKEEYIVGSEAINKGAFLTHDMTAEAANHKMMYALGKAQSENIKRNEIVDFVKNIFYTPIGNDIILP